MSLGGTKKSTIIAAGGQLYREGSLKPKANAGECQGNKPTEGLGVSFVLESLVEGRGQWDGVGGGAFLELPSWLGIMAPLRDRLRDSGLNLTTGRAGRLEA